MELKLTTAVDADKCCEPKWSTERIGRSGGGTVDRTGKTMRQSLRVSRETQCKEKPTGFAKVFGNVANRTSQAAGRASTFIIAACVVIVWAVTGPLFGYSDTWQLVINTGTTIVTFLMVFLIQNSQNRDSAAIQVKLDELIRVSAARNSFVGIEHLTDDELEEIRTKCETRAQAEKTGEVSVEKTGEKARRAADRAVGS